MRSYLLSLSIAVVVLFLASNPAFCQGGDKVGDKSSRTINYQSLVSDRNIDGYRVTVDLSGQVLTLDIPKRTYRPVESVLYPTPAGIKPPEKGAAAERIYFVSASILSAKAKQFDDGLCAAVEVVLEEGSPGLMGKKKFLAALSDALKNLSDPSIPQNEKELARAFIIAASSLGGQDLSDNAKVVELSEKTKKHFLDDPLLSKPIGFYTWNSELGEIFQQDRLLQTKLASPAAVAEAIREKDGQTKDFYFKYLGLVEKMTNPFPADFTDLRPLIKNPARTRKAGEIEKTVLFPPSRSYETDLVKKLFGQKPIPDNFNLAEKLIEEIKAGSINLTPGQNSGWYDYQTYALESLILPEKFPERKKLEFTQSYKEELEELFKLLIALTRETHIKQLEIPMVAGAVRPRQTTHLIRINISPDLTVEPLATYYLRRARSYNFIHDVLKDALGEQSLSKMHRLTASGPVGRDLSSELKEMEALFFGTALIVANETGCALQIKHEDGSGYGVDKDVQFATQWAKNISSDPDVSTDNRMMVPVFYDVRRGMTKVWLVLGYQEESLEAEFTSKPRIKVFDKEGKQIDDSRLDVHYDGQRESLWYPAFAEIYVKKILSRDEFRKLCDSYKTRSEILKALQQ